MHFKITKKEVITDQFIFEQEREVGVDIETLLQQ